MSYNFTVFLSLTFLMCFCTSHVPYYIKVSSNQDKHLDHRSLFRRSVTSGLHCAGHCSRNSTCWEYQFHRSNHCCDTRHSLNRNRQRTGQIEIITTSYVRSGSPERRKVSSCREILECNGSHGDGEYWVYPMQFPAQRARIYCHGMNTSNPEEYVTLVKRNWGEFPDLEIQKPTFFCRKDKVNDHYRGGVGERTFLKIKINITTLVVNTSDTTFAIGPPNILDYGTAHDCYVGHNSPHKRYHCGVKGTFTIDLRGTSFKLDSKQKWRQNGYHPYISVEWNSQDMVKLNCGGHCGGCRPDGQLMLTLKTDPGSLKRRKVSSCREILECNSSYGDGEYWVYPMQFPAQRARIYCHGMNTSNPEEYVTLVKRNWGDFPDLEIRKPIFFCREAKGDDYHKEEVGERTFLKIKINITTLAVNTSDTTFATGPPNILDYGTAWDCYVGHDSPYKRYHCGVKGTFTIDLRGTSFKLDSKQKWRPDGFHPYISVEWNSQDMVKLNCGGHCGGCRPDGQLLVTLKTDPKLPNNSATSVQCSE